MRRLILASLASATLAMGGCRICQGPDDYCGPVYWDGVPVIGFCERHNSVLSPGSFSSRDEFVEEEVVSESDEPIDYVFDSPNESPVIRTQPQSALQPTPAQPREATPVPQSTPAPGQTSPQWTPPKNNTPPMKTIPGPGPIRTTRMP